MTGITPPIVRFIAIDDNPLDVFSILEYAKAFPFLQDCGTYPNALEG